MLKKYILLISTFFQYHCYISLIRVIYIPSKFWYDVVRLQEDGRSAKFKQKEWARSHTWFRRHGWSIRRGPAHFLKTSAHAVAYLRGENTTNKILLQIERLCVAFGRCSYVGSNDDLGQPPPIRSSECKNNSSSHFSFEFRLCRPSEHNKKAREQNRPHFLKRPPIIYFSNPKTIEISTTLQV